MSFCPFLQWHEVLLQPLLLHTMTMLLIPRAQTKGGTIQRGVTRLYPLFASVLVVIVRLVVLPSQVSAPVSEHGVGEPYLRHRSVRCNKVCDVRDSRPKRDN